MGVGESITLGCRAPAGRPAPALHWTQDGERLVAGARHNLNKAGLTISAVEPGDAGRYRCVAVSPAGTRHSRPATLAVFTPPHLIRPPESRTVERGSDVRLQCAVGGVPAPRITWSGPANQEVSGAVLRLRNVSQAAAGEWRCTAENPAGRATAAATLLVEAPPELHTRPTDRTVKPGENISLACSAGPGPGPQLLFWQRPGAPPLLPAVKAAESRLEVTPSLLSVAAVGAGDEGWYACWVVSQAGAQHGLARLTVRDNSRQPPPVIQRGPANQASCCRWSQPVVIGLQLVYHAQFATIGLVSGLTTAITTHVFSFPSICCNVVQLGT